MRANDWTTPPAASPRTTSAHRRAQLERRLGGRLSIGNRRRLGAGLTAFGLTGLVILAASAAFVVEAFGSAGPTGGDLQTQLGALDRSLDATTSALAATKTGTANLNGSVASAATAARGASALATQMATTMHDVSGAMDLSFLGTRPFASLGAEFDQVAARSNDIAGQMNALAGSLDANAADVTVLSGQIGALQTSVQELRNSVGPGSAISGAGNLLSLARGILLALVAWLAVPAIVATWLGVRMYQSTRSPRRPAA